MHTAGLVPGAAQGITQLADVIKRHVLAYSTLYTLAESIKSKATRSCSVAASIRNLIHEFDVPCQAFTYSLDDLREVHMKMTAVIQKIENSSRIRSFFMAPVLQTPLAEIDAKLSGLDIFFRTVSDLSTVNSSQHSETRHFVQLILSN